MKKYLLQKAVSLTAAATLGCTSMIGTGGINVSAFPKTDSALSASAPTEVSTEPVNVIVTVRGEAVLAGEDAAGKGAEYIETPEAVDKRQELDAIQASIEAQIREIYPELEVRFNYDLVCNGFACKLPEDLLDQVRALPDVEEVAVVRDTATPQMKEAKDFSGYPAFFDATGSSGEGQVICVIDGGFDVHHPMFAALDENTETKLSQEDIADIIVNAGLNVDCEARLAYRSSKVPFAVNYCENNYAGVAKYTTHGTHVAGIAAGNEYKTSEGNTISGIARDAQLILMAIGVDEIHTDTLAGIAAMEDAVKLHADVINMSYGSRWVEMFENDALCNLETEVFAAVENAGIVMCTSAGNDANGTLEGDVNLASNPDTNTMDDIPDGSSAMVVASADNTISLRQGVIESNGVRVLVDEGFAVGYNESITTELSGDYEYEYCGLGYPQDFEGKDLTGKIALVDRGTLMFIEKAANAAAAGAEGMLVVNYEGNTDALGADPDAAIPYAHLAFEDGQILKNAEKKVVSFTSEKIDTLREGTAVSEFSSWGVKENLEIRPDIMGIGGDVESAYGADQTMVIQGTSMASPYVAGCAAIVNEYLQKKGIELTGREKAVYIRNLMMNSASLYQDNGLYCSPRQQGAGLVNLNNLLADKVILTGKEGDAKINLFDKLGDTFDFDVDITNLSDEDVKFTSAKLVLTTEGSEFDEEVGADIISGQVALNCTADVSALQSVAAGETRKEHISVALDAAQTAEIAKAFVNGFFVEGYLILEGAENCCDISVPVLGFHGDWAQVPVFAAYGPSFRVNDHCKMSAGYSFAKAAELTLEIDKQIPQDQIAADGSNYADLLAQYATLEQMQALAESAGVPTVSPNGDGLAEEPYIDLILQRSAMCQGLRILDADGKVIKEAIPGGSLKNVEYFCSLEEVIDDLPDGEYTASVAAYIHYDGAEENPQTADVPFVIDNTAPKLETALEEKDGRKILTITASDAMLDGIFVVGAGTAGVAGAYDPASIENPLDSIGALQWAPMLLGAKQLYSIASTFDTAGKSVFETVIGTGAPDFTQLEACTFSDLLVAEPDENGVYTVEYDVTDLPSYSITAFDRAFNTATVSTDSKAESIEPGFYKSKDGAYVVTEQNVTYRSYEDGRQTVYNYTVEDGVLTLTADNTSASYNVEKVSDLMYRLTAADGSVADLRMAGLVDEPISPFLTNAEVTEQCKALVEAASPETPVTRTETENLANGQVIITLYGEDENGEEYLLDKFAVDRFTCETKEYMYGKTMNLIPLPLDLSSRGCWDSMDGRYFFFDTENGKGCYYLQADGSKHEFTFTVEDDMLNITADGETTSYMYYVASPDTLSLADPNGNGALLYYNGRSERDLHFYSSDELLKMAVDYYTEHKGKTPEQPQITDGFVDTPAVVEISFADGEVYHVSTENGTGHDIYGYDVDLCEKNAIMEDPFREGVYVGCGDASINYYWFKGNGTGICKSLDTGENKIFRYTMTKNGADIRLGGRVFAAYLFPHEDGTIAIAWNDEDHRNETLTFKQQGGLGDTFYTTDQIADMAEVDYQKASGINTSGTSVMIGEDGMYTIILTDENDTPMETYTIDPLTGSGVRGGQTPVDLPKTGNNKPGAAAGAAGAAILTATGFFAMLRSGLFRRKKEQ